MDKAKEGGDKLASANQLAETMCRGLDSISKEIRDLRADMKSLTAFGAKDFLWSSGSPLQ